jgi:short-subunit dehydrogenase involved in D-alanine esterification of teichoic acids
MNFKSIFITGGAGFIGYNCAEFFLKKKFKIKIFDNISRTGSKINLKKIKKNKSIIFEKGDLKNFKHLNQSIKKFKPTLIINCAGQVAVTTSIKNPRADFLVSDLMEKDVRVFGITGVNLAKKMPYIVPKFLTLLEKGTIKFHIHRVFSLENANGQIKINMR